MVNKLLIPKTLGLDSFTGKFYPIFKREMISIVHILFQKIETKRTLPN
jgi:hypothetical protein